jgi:hypothetical protein
MKKVLFLGLLALWALGCNKAESSTDVYPAEPIPDELVGKWQKGSFSMINYFTYDGRDLGKGYESTRALHFTKNGQAEVFIYVHSYNSAVYCHSHGFTYTKGTVAINGNQLTIKPRAGRYRGAYAGNCGSLANFDRPMTEAEVAKQELKFYWSRESRSGKNYLVLRSNPNANDVSSDFFSPTSW